MNKLGRHIWYGMRCALAVRDDERQTWIMDIRLDMSAKEAATRYMHIYDRYPKTTTDGYIRSLRVIVSLLSCLSQ